MLNRKKKMRQPIKKREAAEKKAATKKVKTSDEFPPEVDDSVRLQTLAQRGM